MAAFALQVPPGASLDVQATLRGSTASVFLYGPRDQHGGTSACLSRGTNDDVPARAGIEDATPGEYLVVAGPRPGAPGGEVTVTVHCSECEAAPSPCPTLADLGCPDIRCDGELALDDSGCLTCECQTGHVCGPERGDGPWGTCILPACDCTLAQAIEVCGADGRTWPSACAARCAGVPVAADGDCASACPALAGCDAPCWGLRVLDPTSGCPTCDCATSVPTNVTDCAACTLDEAPVCGADGVTYPNRCVARCAGAKLLYAAACVTAHRRQPDGCDLDCPWGLRLGDDGLLCDCADVPDAGCQTSGDTVCAHFDGLGPPTTVGSPCLAMAMGAAAAELGPCGVPCEANADCPIGSTCRGAGALSGRCLLLGERPCDCSAVVDFVCGANGQTYPNSCHLRCATVDEAHRGPCCDALSPAPCEEGDAPAVDVGGCSLPDAACDTKPPACVEDTAAVPESCSADGEVHTSTCAAHLAGVQASPAWCSP